MTPRAAVIIPAAGFGTRMNLDHPKQFHLLDGIPILVRTIRPFHDLDFVTRIVVVVPAGMIEHTVSLLSTYGLNDRKLSVIAGGCRRQDSVRAGLDTLDSTTEVVLVHDGARPFVTRELIVRCYRTALAGTGAIAAIPVKDTLKRGNEYGRVEATIDRTSLYQAQTPQAATLATFIEAYRINGDEDVTDESSLLERAAIPVTLVEGAETNIKITRPEDLVLAEKILGRVPPPAFRIGHGYDAHRFALNRPLVLGGVTIAHSHGLAGHSDADVLTHALCDAILGALGCGDIGRHFPDSDARFAGIYSVSLLEQVMMLAEERGYRMASADITVVCQAPRLAGFIPEMIDILSQACRVTTDTINIKATTTEGMGFTGRKEGIGCHAVVLLQK